jgi:hypothetical protein
MISVRLTALAALAAAASTAAIAAPAPPQPIIPNPTYAVIPLEITVNRPAAVTWAKVGPYCAIGEWLRIPAGCQMLAGKGNEVGAIRSVGAEVLVAATPMSYTYTQTPKVGVPYNMYHGTLEVRPVTANTSKIVYTLIFDNSMLADDAARAADIAGRKARFGQAMIDMKTLAEGGKLQPLPPAPAR